MDNSETSKPLITSGRFQQRIVICGSMSFYGDMLAVQNQLRYEGILSVVPEAENDAILSLPEKDFSTFKRRVSSQYLRVIRAPETIAVLAVNRDKHGMRDYIGPNTFAEIAVAFAQHKRIFLLQGIPDMYLDELEAWRAISLDGDLSEIRHYYKATVTEIHQQMRLFDDI